ncbi:MORN (Membrane Occupation and Recognition Nexus)repeat-containing protein [Striga asiatica]|uniref:MORN (Membrane Occupation and Recognition Nexus)repeat-containing protein n=1 Tax=Striga asiatica TaxID=4170 RepID=A0A5A7PNB8_STRAF|nr:MORN (Membrane Occupation and Recognition Nexus)repeat-containing protein [Striga asiatica]
MPETKEELQPEENNSNEYDSETEASPSESSDEYHSEPDEPESPPPEYDDDFDNYNEPKSDFKDAEEEEELYKPIRFVRADGTIGETSLREPFTDLSAEANFARWNRILQSKGYRQHLEEEKENVPVIDRDEYFNFPEDPENWQEEDVRELWADRPMGMVKTGFDPHNVDEEEVKIIQEEIKAGRKPRIAPFYVPYRKPYPVIPERKENYNVYSPKTVIEELDRIEEFLTWRSYIFEDGSSYEGTVWDDYAHGKGVFVAENGLVRYEGEWLQNNMEGHGVVEVDIPTMEPIPGSKLEKKMRAEGKIISRDFLPPEDKKWLEMDIEDSMLLADGELEVPFYEKDDWIRLFGRKPEKGRYRYAGQWKHGRMHGCGVYEVNEKTIFGRFYFGLPLDDPSGCDAEASGRVSPQLHAGIAEVAAAKARMFVNKPDGMVREDRGPYSDPQHPYFYEEEDVWMAPGFINQFYEVPDYWKTYVDEVDQERQMWLNSFYKAPLRLPMPSELEYWWEKGDEEPEFVLINKEPEPDPENPSQLIYSEDPLILHTPTGMIINHIEDEEHGIRLFWQPPLKEGETVNPDEARFLPLGFDEFYGLEEVREQENPWRRFVTSVENKCKSFFEGMEKRAEERKKVGMERMELLREKMELVDAEFSLKEAVEDLDEELKRMQKEEEKGGGLESEKTVDRVEEDEEEKEEEEEEEEEDDDDDDDDDDDEDDDGNGVNASSFGSTNDKIAKNGDERSKGKSAFAAASLSFSSSSLMSLVPPKLQTSFLSWKEGILNKSTPSQLPHESRNFCTVSCPRASCKVMKLKVASRRYPVEPISKHGSRKYSKRRECERVFEELNVLSLHTPLMM